MWNLVRICPGVIPVLLGSVHLSVKVIVVVFIEHWTTASSSGAMGWTGAACGTGGKSERQRKSHSSILSMAIIL